MSVRINLSDLTVQDRTKRFKSLRLINVKHLLININLPLQYTHMISKK